MPPFTNTSYSSAGRRSSIYARRQRSNSVTSNSSTASRVSSKTKSTSPLGIQVSVGTSSTSTCATTQYLTVESSLSVMGSASTSTSASASTSSSSSSTSTSASSLSYRSSSTSVSKKNSSSSEVRNILLENEYQDEVVAHMRHMESQTMPSVELMDVQPELRWFMRPYLVDFLIEIHQTFRLRPETLFLTMNIVDRYVSKRIVYKRHYQLVGCAALLIAAKFEDSKDRVPTVNDLSQMCCNAYDESAFTQMEGHVLSTIGWVLGHPTAEAWLRLESVRANDTASTINVARFLLEASLFQRDFIPLTPSALSRGALIIARAICASKPSDVLSEAAQMLDTYISENLDDLSLILVKKHSHAHAHSTNASALVSNWYRARSASARSSSASALLPAQTLVRSSHQNSDLALASEDEDEDEDEEQDESMLPTPLSTPSRSMDQDEDDDDLPLTPLSAYRDLINKENRAPLTHHPTAKPLPEPEPQPTSASRHPHSHPLGSTTSWNVQL